MRIQRLNALTRTAEDGVITPRTLMISSPGAFNTVQHPSPQDRKGLANVERLVFTDIGLVAPVQSDKAEWQLQREWKEQLPQLIDSLMRSADKEGILKALPRLTSIAIWPDTVSEQQPISALSFPLKEDTLSDSHPPATEPLGQVLYEALVPFCRRFRLPLTVHPLDRDSTINICHFPHSFRHDADLFNLPSFDLRFACADLPEREYWTLSVPKGVHLDHIVRQVMYLLQQLDVRRIRDAKVPYPATVKLIFDSCFVSMASRRQLVAELRSRVMMLCGGWEVASDLSSQVVISAQ